METKTPAAETLAHTETGSEEETIAFGRTIAGELRRGEPVLFIGDLGAGKTRLIKGICSFFGVREQVTSPTFILLNEYKGKDGSGAPLAVHHFDLYRIRSIEEIMDLGYEEFFFGDGIALVEWGELLGPLAPQRRLEIRIAHRGDDRRSIEAVRFRA